jgi:hypothetical protein
MRILVYAADPSERKLSAFYQRAVPPGAEFEVLAYSTFMRSYRKRAPGAFVYLDASAEPDIARLVECGARLGALEGCAWGVFDRQGLVDDPAGLFFAGAKDYLGPHTLRSGIDPERVRQAFAFAGLIVRQGAQTPTSAFPGWNGIQHGAEIQARFCYAAVGNQRELLERIGEKRLNRLRESFAAFLDPWAKECDGLVWIREPAGNLLLFPPRDAGMNPVLAAFRLLLDRALIGYEVFKLETPLTFRFAFHYGATIWKPPGSTGTIVSDDVNFIFHLGTKAAEDGVILVSEESKDSVPICLRDLFASAGDFEGRTLWASKRFRD